MSEPKTARKRLAELRAKPLSVVRRPRPRLVCVAGRIVGDAVVIVSPSDPNWYKGPKAVLTDGEVRVRCQ